MTAKAVALKMGLTVNVVYDAAARKKKHSWEPLKKSLDFEGLLERMDLEKSINPPMYHLPVRSRQMGRV